jgi:hypothetical protein
MAAAQPRKKTLRRVHSAAKTGNLRAALGKSWAMVLQRACSGRHFADAAAAGELRRVRACVIDVMSLPSAQSAAPIPG